MMSDTQWPRWEVFKQDTPQKPHQAVGSVHAADPEHALLTARNVYVRRPRAVSLWVVLAEQIFSMTQEELTTNPKWNLKDSPPDAPSQCFSIFRKTSHRRSMTFVDHIDDIEATSPQAALQQAIETWTDKPALAWWVVPVEAITCSESEVVKSWFDPALSKTYKQQSAYGKLSALKKKADDSKNQEG